jgi:formylglycine-generating enzyme required for sulfatase activity
MAKAPGERYETPGELASDLDRLTGGEEPGALAAPPKKSTVARRPRAKVRPAAGARRPAAKRAGADVPRRARDYAAARGRGSKTPYAIAGGAVVVLAVLGIILAGGSKKKPRERRRPLPPVAVTPEPVAPPPAPPVVETEPPDPAEEHVPEVAPPAPTPIAMPVPPVPAAGAAAARHARIARIPADAVEFAGHWYKGYEQGVIWRDAKAFCERQGGHLATITSKEENDFIAGLLPTKNSYYWIGFTDEEQEGRWEWVTGEPVTFKVWAEGEPNNAGGIENHAMLSPAGGTWIDKHEVPFFFVCEWEPGTKAVGATRGLVGHWKFDETEGAVARDSSGKGNDGTVKGGAKWAKGRIGGALAFDGKDDCVVIARPVQDDLTIAVWMKTSQAGTEVRGGATVKGQWYYGAGLVDGEVDDIQDDFGTSLAGGTFRFGTGNPDTTIASVTSVDDGAWHHVAATRVRRTGALAVYVDGVREATGTGGTQSLVKPLRLTIGRVQGKEGYFGGLIDDVRIYDRALSGREVKALYEGRGRPTEPEAPTRPRRLLAELDELLMKGDYAAARKWAEGVAGRAEYAEVAKEIASVEGVCRAMESRSKAALAGARARVGRKVELAGRLGKPRKGELKAVAEKGIDLVTRFAIVAGGKRHEREKRVTVAWAELAPSQVDELAREGGWKPAAADAAVARAYLALGRRKPKAAVKALERARDHPLAEHILGLIGELARPAEEARARKPEAPAPTLTLDLGGGVTMELVYIKPGVFIMGGTEGPRHAAQGVEKPKHEVAITRGFYIGKYEVTQSQYEAVMGGNPSKWKEPNRPVEQVTWHEAAEFCRLATERTPRHVRLPAEAEWEYACRAGSTGRYCFGSDETGLADYAWLRNNSGGQTHPVGERKPNAWGLHDMHGNVWEWVADRYDADYYAKSPRENPAGPDSGRGRVVRGGAWANRGSGSRSAYRLWFAPSHRSTHFGFRVAVDSSVPRALSASQRAAYDRAMARAKIRVRLKNWKGAVESLEEALKAKPGDPEAERLLAEAKRYAGPAPTLTLDLGRGVTMEMVYIKPGVFAMGGTEDPGFPWQGVEKPKHRVAITRGFYIGKYEVTQSQHEAVTGANPSSWKEPNRPVEQMSWDDAVEFCRLASERTGKEVRLPTEAEWEYACRAGSTREWCFGNERERLGEYAWYKSNSGDRTHAVGQKKPNAWGLYDMHGNVWEWVADRYGPGYFATSPRENPTGPAAGSHRVLRGAALCDSGRLCRTAIRCHLPPTARSHVHGFRAVASAAPGPTALSPRAKAIYKRAMALARIRVRLKNWEGAVEPLEEALKAKPGDPEAERLLAEAKLHTAPEPTLTVRLGEGITIEMVYIKPGVFTMGGTVDANPNSSWQGIEKPKHEVAITQGFYMGKYEVTQAQYEAVTGTNPSAWKAPDLPVEQVTWLEAAEFCRLATERTRRQFSMPTEAEWEYACRAGSTGSHGFDSSKAGLSEYAWHRGNAGGRTHPVGGRKPNAWGIHDMHGNVWEWVADWYAADYYSTSPREDPAGPDTGKVRMLRGGSWYADIGFQCRAAFRHFCLPSARYHTLGFRVASASRPSGQGARKRAAPASTAGATAPTIRGRWHYQEFGNAYSREFTADGKCIFRKAGTLVWSVPYRLKEGKAIVTMPDGLVLVHELTSDGRLSIEGKFLASKKGRR